MLKGYFIDLYGDDMWNSGGEMDILKLVIISQKYCFWKMVKVAGVDDATGE